MLPCIARAVVIWPVGCNAEKVQKGLPLGSIYKALGNAKPWQWPWSERWQVLGEGGEEKT